MKYKQPKQTPKPSEKSAFGIMISMLVIMALMIAVVSFHKAWQFITDKRFTSNLRNASSILEQYSIVNGSFPPMATPGVMPRGTEDMLNKIPWTNNTPLGGQWDWVTNAPKLGRGIRIYMPDVSEKRMKNIDEKIDDGNLRSGRLQLLEDDTGYLYKID